MNQAPYRSLVNPTRERVFLVGVWDGRREARMVAPLLDELAQLAESAGAIVVGKAICRQNRPLPATFIGRGKATEIAAQAAAVEATLVIFDDDLSPVQGRNLESILQKPVIDRTQLILDIFARNAHTREGVLQVNLARMEYLLPRLRHMWSHLERQRGGIGHMGGAGEQQIELDRRRIEERMARFKEELEHVRRHRSEQRRGRRRHGWALLTMVGYTNAGKSTLMNALTQAGVLTQDKLFATLDPTTRQLDLPNHQPALLTDTVGFIRKLPHHLVDAFKATLEEVLEADLLLHVVDASHPQAMEQAAAVEHVLEDLGASAKPMVTVLNKIDLPGGPVGAEWMKARFQRSVPVSAIHGEGLGLLREEIADCLKERNRDMCLRVPAADGAFLALIKSQCRIHSEDLDGDQVVLSVSIPVRLESRCAKYCVQAKTGRRR